MPTKPQNGQDPALRENRLWRVLAYRLSVTPGRPDLTSAKPKPHRNATIRFYASHDDTLGLATAAGLAEVYTSALTNKDHETLIEEPLKRGGCCHYAIEE